MMEELETVLAFGAGAVSKLVDQQSGYIERIFNYKFPYEYIGQFGEMLERKGKVKAFYERKDFAKQNKRLDASAINRLCEQDMAGLIDAAENAYLETIRSTVERYLDGWKLHKMILISGPSGSGKTTTSYRLTDELKQHGLNPVVLSLDNFSQPSEMRRNRDGSIRYDSVHSINLQCGQPYPLVTDVPREAVLPAL